MQRKMQGWAVRYPSSCSVPKIGCARKRRRVGGSVEVGEKSYPARWMPRISTRAPLTLVKNLAWSFSNIEAWSFVFANCRSSIQQNNTSSIACSLVILSLVRVWLERLVENAVPVELSLPYHHPCFSTQPPAHTVGHPKLACFHLRPDPGTFGQEPIRMSAQKHSCAPCAVTTGVPAYSEYLAGQS